MAFAPPTAEPQVRRTIFAPATAPGRAGVAILRVSGPGAASAITALAGRLPPPRRASRARLRHPATGDLLDDALVLWFPGPASFTGEDVAEFHIHGGRALKEAVMAALGGLPDLRLAEAGEFTRRALLNDRLDLTEAEALADLIDADTEAQRRQALRQAEGALTRACDSWRTEALRLLAHLEATLDFPDEEDIPDDLETGVAEALRRLADSLNDTLNDRHRGERLREGLQVAVVGPPNAGKSSLVNRLARRDAAIVSDTAGTTRDVIEVHLDLGGYPLVLADTAGLRDTGDAIEAEGVRRARARLEDADLVLVVRDGTPGQSSTDPVPERRGPDTLRVWTRGDLYAEGSRPRAAAPDDLVVSCLTGAGFAGLETALATRARALMENGASGTAVLTRARHRAAVEEARDALERAMAAPSADLRAEDLRLALRAIGRITGRVDVEEVLDVIFRDFCLGK